jgi:hypothetical protein
MTRRRLVKAGLTVIALLAVVVSAWAYWTTQGSGSAAATAGTLGAPTNVAASATGSTVSVSWTGSTLSNGTPAQGYFVTRTNISTSATSAACGSSASSLVSGTSCSDTSVPNGNYTYKVTAVYHTWTAESAASGNVTVAAVTLDHFSVSAPGSATAGTAFSVTVVAKDASNNTLTGYTGTIHFASSDSNSPTLPSNYTFVGGDNGSQTFTNGVTLKTSGSQTVTVNDTVQTSKTGTATISVSAGALDHFSVSAPGSATAGTAFSATVIAKDVFDNTLTGYTGTIHFASSDSNSPVLPSNYTYVAGDNGSHTFTNGVTLKTSGSQTVTVNDTVQTSKTGSATINVSAGALDHFSVSAPGTATAGTAFTVSATAKDVFNNTLTGYTGTIHFASSDSNSPTLPSNYTFVGGDNGSHTFTNGVTLKTPGSQTVTVNDTVQTSKTGTATISVSAGPLDHFSVTAPSSATAGTAFSVTVVAKDAANNTLTGYTGTIHFASSDSNSPTLPSNYTYIAGDNGSHTFTNAVTLKTSGSQTVTANDTVQISKTGSATISVSAGTAHHFDLTAPASATAGSAFTVTLTAQDVFNNTATSYANGNHTITWSGASTSPAGNAPNYPTSTVSFTNGVSTTTLSATLFDAGANSLTASASSPSLTDTTSISVAAGSAARLAWTNITSSSGTAVPTTCLFTCTYAAFGNNSNFTANVSVTDTWGNTVSALGSGHTVSVTRGGDGGAFTAPTTGNPVSLTISAAGPAESTTTFTFRSQSGSWTSDSLTAQTTAGTVYTNATATLNKN